MRLRGAVISTFGASGSLRPLLSGNRAPLADVCKPMGVREWEIWQWGWVGVCVVKFKSGNGLYIAARPVPGMFRQRAMLRRRSDTIGRRVL